MKKKQFAIITKDKPGSREKFTCIVIAKNKAQARASFLRGFPNDKDKIVSITFDCQIP